jgi:hypothetical protein
VTLLLHNVTGIKPGYGLVFAALLGLLSLAPPNGEEKKTTRKEQKKRDL